MNVQRIAVIPNIQEGPSDIGCHHVKNKGGCVAIQFPCHGAQAFRKLMPYFPITRVFFGCDFFCCRSSAALGRWFNEYRVCRNRIANPLDLGRPRFWGPHKPECHAHAWSLNVVFLSIEDRSNAFASVITHHAHQALWTFQRFVN